MNLPFTCIGSYRKQGTIATRMQQLECQKMIDGLVISRNTMFTYATRISRH